jgi:Tol biopolymer transport system component
MADGESWGPRLSADGRQIVFASTARNLGGPPPRAGEARILVHDLRRGTTRLVSIGADGGALPGFASEPTVSADGRTVAFSLAPRDALRRRSRGRPPQRVHVRDLATPTAHSVGPARGYAGQPAIAAGASRVAFTADGGSRTLRVLRASTRGNAAQVLRLPSSTFSTARDDRAVLCRLAPPVW